MGTRGLGDRSNLPWCLSNKLPTREFLRWAPVSRHIYPVRPRQALFGPLGPRFKDQLLRWTAIQSNTCNFLQSKVAKDIDLEESNPYLPHDACQPPPPLKEVADIGQQDSLRCGLCISYPPVFRRCQIGTGDSICKVDATVGRSRSADSCWGI